MDEDLQIYELEDQKTNVIEDLFTKEKILMINARSFKIQNRLIRKDASIYRGGEV